MDKNLNTDCTEDTDLALSQIFLVSKWYWIYFQIFVDSRVLGHSLFLKSIRYHSIEYITLSYTQKEVPKHLQILLNPKQKSKNHWLNIIKKWIREKTNPCSSVISVFHFLICGPAAGWGHNGNTE